MCINLKSNYSIQTTEEDLKVLKVVDKRIGKLHSPVFLGGYEPEAERVEELNIIPDGFTKGEYCTTTGLYSFTSDCDPKWCKNQLRSFGDNLEVWLAVIPKDSRYVKEGCQICSESLKLISKIC